MNTTNLFVTALLFLIGAYLAFLFFTGQGSEEPDPYATFNGYTFTRYEGLWRTEWQNRGAVYVLDFHFHPLDVQPIPITGQADERFSQPDPYITFDPEGDNLSYVAVANGKLSRSMLTSFGITPVIACTRNVTDACASLPIITCDTTNKPVIYLRDASPTLVQFDGNCLRIQGSETELIRATERFLYSWYRILR